MDRRRFLAGSAALAATAARAPVAVDDLRTAAREAWIYGLPLVEMAAARGRMMAAGASVNAFSHQRALAGPLSRTVATPNCDTLYSSAWLDLSSGPVTLVVPETGARYFSLALLDFFTNNFAIVGQRRTGGDGGEFTVVGPPGRIGMAGVTIPRPRLPDLPLLRRPIQAPGRWVWALARTLVEGEADLAAAHTLQDSLYIRAHAGHAPQPFPGPAAPWNDYFYAVQQLVEETPPPRAELGFFRRIAPLQLGMRGGFERARFADSEVAGIEAGVAEARALVAAPPAPGDAVGGWIYPRPDLGDFGEDYLYRARVAQAGLGALPPREALYMRAVAADGRAQFAGGGLYRLSLAAPPPVRGFWSLTLYEVTPQGRLFLTKNSIGRYAVGDRTGLVRRADGGYDIWIGREDPGGAHTANWLPAPARGPFALVMRAYLPGPDLLDGRYRLAPVKQLKG